MSFCCAPFDTAMIAVQADVRSVICAWNASLDFAERNRTHRCPLEVVEKGPGMKGTNLTSIGDRASQFREHLPYYWGATPVGYVAAFFFIGSTEIPAAALGNFDDRVVVLP
jgi:hypothetical protein